MFHFLHKTKRPVLPDLNPGDFCLVFDHTHAAYRSLANWIKTKWPDNKPVLRLKNLYCVSGCQYPWVHESIKCCGEIQRYVHSRPHDFPYETEIFDKSNLDPIETWLETYWKRIHRIIDDDTGDTPMAQFCQSENWRSTDDLAVLASNAFGISVNEIEIPGSPSIPGIPFALTHGPVPFDPESIKDAIQKIRDGDPPELRPLHEVTKFGTLWVSQCDHDGTAVVRLPYGTKKTDYPNHDDQSTFSQLRLIGPAVERRWVYELETVSGKIFNDPISYLRYYIRTSDETNRMKRLGERMRLGKRNDFIRTVLVNAKFRNEFGDEKRKYLDEYKMQKKLRISKEYGTEYVDEFMNIPMMELGPDFEKD